MPSRFLTVALVLVAASCLLAGCNLFSSGEKTSRTLRASSNFLRFSADQAVPGSALADAAGLFDDAVRQQQAARHLDQLANSPDPFGSLLAHAMCTGMNQLAQQPEEDGPVSEETWEGFLVDQVNIIAPGNPYNTVVTKVDAFVTAGRLAEVSPRGAQIYLQQCVTRAR